MINRIKHSFVLTLFPHCGPAPGTDQLHPCNSSCNIRPQELGGLSKLPPITALLPRYIPRGLTTGLNRLTPYITYHGQTTHTRLVSAIPGLLHSRPPPLLHILEIIAPVSRSTPRRFTWHQPITSLAHPPHSPLLGFLIVTPIQQLVDRAEHSPHYVSTSLYLRVERRTPPQDTINSHRQGSYF